MAKKTPTRNQSRQVKKSTSGTSKKRARTKTIGTDAINQQYGVIRKDVIKLKKDIAHGYDLIKELLETRLSRRILLQDK